MDYLHVCAKANLVHWAVRRNDSNTYVDSGALLIENLPSTGLITNAEILAAWHLLTVEKVLGENRIGQQITIVFSHQKATDVFNGLVEEREYLIYTNALRTRFAGASVSVDFNNYWVEDDIAYSVIQAYVPSIVFYNKKMGFEIELSYHSLVRWHSRVGGKSIAKSYKKLAEVVSERNLYKIDLRTDVLAQKQQKYANYDSEHYTAVLSQGIRFVFKSLTDGRKKLVTVYNVPKSDALF